MTRPDSRPTPAASPDAFEEILGYRFRDPALLAAALTHPSAPGGGGYERLEFIGDRVLGLAVAELLHRLHPDEAVGSVAQRHGELVSEPTLAGVAAALGVDLHLRTAPGVQLTRAKGAAILADACEAVIGAIFLDGGYGAAAAFVEARWLELVREHKAPPRDPKSRLQEWAQSRGLAPPGYAEVARAGPAHAPVFTVEATLSGFAPARGEGASKQKAEKAAAAALLALVGAD